MSAKPRVLIVGGGFKGAILACLLCKEGITVDLVEEDDVYGYDIPETFTIPDSSIRDVFCGNGFLAQRAMVCRGKGSPCESNLLGNFIFQYLSMLPKNHVRRLHSVIVTHLLTCKDENIVKGIRYETGSYKKCKSAANFFANLIIVTQKPKSLELPSKSMGNLWDLTNGDNADFIDTFDKMETFIREKILTVKPNDLTNKGVKMHTGFRDHKGVYHESTLAGDKWVELRLQNRLQQNATNHLFRFELPSPDHQIGLFCGQYIAIRIKDPSEGSGPDDYIVRYYSPVSRNSDYGIFDLLIKIEGDLEKRPMAKYLSMLEPGGTLEVSGPLGGFEYHRNSYREIGMIAGGTGITPMVQIIRSIANHPEDKTKAVLLYGNYNEEDILCKEELCYYAHTRDNVEVHISLNNCPENWSLDEGFIDKNLIEKRLPKPAHDIIILLCGPPAMVKIMKELLRKANYLDSMIYSFV